MGYRTILVNLDLDGPIRTPVELAVELTSRINGKLIGFCAADARKPMLGPEGANLAAKIWNEDKADIECHFKKIRNEFDQIVASTIETEWRSMQGHPTRSLSKVSRTADLIIMSAIHGVKTGNAYRNVDPGNAVLQLGRPLLIIANDTDRLFLNTVVIAWRDTPEARRAVSDAMPLLRLANEVIVVTVVQELDDQERNSITDVARYLQYYGVEVNTEVLQSDDEIRTLIDFITMYNTDLIVAGAYGHSRVREWVFGGITRALLDEVTINRFMSC